MFGEDKQWNEMMSRYDRGLGKERWGRRMRKVTFLVTRFPSSSVNCSSVTDSPGRLLASSPCGESLSMTE